MKAPFATNADWTINPPPEFPIVYRPPTLNTLSDILNTISIDVCAIISAYAQPFDIKDALLKAAEYLEIENSRYGWKNHMSYVDNGQYMNILYGFPKPIVMIAGGACHDAVNALRRYALFIQASDESMYAYSWVWGILTNYHNHDMWQIHGEYALEELRKLLVKTTHDFPHPADRGVTTYTINGQMRYALC